ncbi:MAG: hypothetical protein GAK41_00709 [Burkholderia gladioli]|nr:MAG: hypothetical protein GAK41_00709 [Burkholderia gladioli]
MSAPTQIQNKVVVITGARSGLGARRVERIDALAVDLTAHGAEALAVATDVTHRDPRCSVSSMPPWPASTASTC